MRRALRIVGAAATVAGLLTGLLAGTVPLLPIGGSYLVVLLVASGLLLLSLDGVVSRSVADPEHASAVGVEQSHEVPIPGDDLDRELEHGDMGAFRRRLSQRVVESLVRRHGYAEPEAVDRVEAGEWTDDPVAASMLADDRRAPLFTRFAWWLRDTPVAEERARRAVDALAHLRERTPQNADGGSGPLADATPAVDGAETATDDSDDDPTTARRPRSARAGARHTTDGGEQAGDSEQTDTGNQTGDGEQPDGGERL